MPDVVHYRSSGVSLVLDLSDRRLPRVLHWGKDLGELADDSLIELRRLRTPRVVTNSPDAPVAVAVIPEQASGWMGTPGLRGHRAGRDFSSLFTVESARITDDDGADLLIVDGSDRSAGLLLTLEIGLTAQGLVRMRGTLTNVGDDTFEVDELMLTLPVPEVAVELLDLTGRHLRERSPQRSPFLFGQRVRENRRGRTGLDASLVMIAGESGFGFRAGEVWAIHPAWSGNHRLVAERNVDGAAFLAGSELLLAGEVRLAPGGTYASPWILGSHGQGLDEMSARFHRYLARHPVRPRPVTMNTWEAVFFEQSMDRLSALADRAARVGCERFVLDDGWFRGRRDDTAGLGDWQVDATVWPDGLDPLIDRVNNLGMEFGLWVEPEMVNPNSDLARQHPEWVLAPGARLPGTSRNQWVLNLAHPEAFRHIFTVLDELLAKHHIEYLKWDHNRDLIETGHRLSGASGVHDQTLAVYRLIDVLRDRHPHIEIESCSSGGGRVDAAILGRTERIWTSDCIDALERQQIQTTRSRSRPT